MTTVEPTVIDVPGSSGVIWLATDGAVIWVASNDEILRIDGATSAVTSLPAPSKSDDTTLAIAADGLWMTRWAGDMVYRLDPATGEVQLSTELDAAVRLAFVGEDLWAGRESTREMVLVDRETGALGRTVTGGAYAAAGLGDLWFASTGSVRRVDPATGAVDATIEVPAESNCGLSGEFPANAWLSCFGREVMVRAATRIDPVQNRVAVTALLPPSHGGSVVILDGQAWLVGAFEDAAGSPFAGLLRLNGETGTIEQFVSIGHADPDTAVVAAGAIWVPDESGHRILRVDRAALSG